MKYCSFLRYSYIVMGAGKIAILRHIIFKYCLRVFPLICRVNQCLQVFPSHSQPAAKAQSQLLLEAVQVKTPRPTTKWHKQVQVLNARPMRLFLCPKKIMKNLFTRRPKTSTSKATWKNWKHLIFLIYDPSSTPCNGSKSIQRHLYGSWSDI